MSWLKSEGKKPAANRAAGVVSVVPFEAYTNQVLLQIPGDSIMQQWQQMLSSGKGSWFSTGLMECQPENEYGTISSPNLFDYYTENGGEINGQRITGIIGDYGKGIVANPGDCYIVDCYYYCAAFGFYPTSSQQEAWYFNPVVLNYIPSGFNFVGQGAGGGNFQIKRRNVWHSYKGDGPGGLHNVTVRGKEFIVGNDVHYGLYSSEGAVITPSSSHIRMQLGPNGNLLDAIYSDGVYDAIQVQPGHLCDMSAQFGFQVFWDSYQQKLQMGFHENLYRWSAVNIYDELLLVVLAIPKAITQINHPQYPDGLQ